MSSRLFALMVTVLCMLGCHGSSEDAVKPPEWMKPPPQTPEQAQMSAAQMAAGERAKQQSAKAAAAMRAAKERAGIQ